MLMLIVNEPVASEQILTKLSPILSVGIVLLVVGVCVKGLWEKEDLKKTGAKFLFGALLAVIVKKPELFFTIGEKIADVITTIIGYFA